jgi:hypothetical protein
MAGYHQYVRKIIASSVHVIVTVRQDEAREQVRTDKGKVEIHTLGLKNQAEKNFPFEMDFVFNIDKSHKALVDKQEGRLFPEGIPFTISEDTGLAIVNWLAGGSPKRAPGKRDLFIGKIQAFLTTENFQYSGKLYSEEQLYEMTLDELTDYGQLVSAEHKAFLATQD